MSLPITILPKAVHDAIAGLDHDTGEVDTSPRIAGPNGLTVRGRELAKTFMPHRVQIVVPNAVSATQVGSVNGLDFSASKKIVRSGQIVDTILVSVPANGMYWGISLTSEIEYYPGGALGAGVCAMRSEFVLGRDAGLSIMIPVHLKHHEVNVGVWSPNGTSAGFTDYCTVTFARLGDGRVG